MDQDTIAPKARTPKKTAEDLDQADVLDRFVAQLYETVPDLDPRDRKRIKGFVAKLRQEFGGDRVYVRKDVTVVRRERALELFNGRNASEVARELGVSRATVYRLLKTPG